MRLRLTDEEFEQVRAYLSRTAGLVFDASRRPGLSSVLADRLAATGAAGVPSYLSYVADPDGEVERARLLDAVTVQETHFFRNPPQIEALRRRVLPELLRRSAGRERPLTIWSAGCSTGEEPYTLAMLLLELSPSLGSGPAAPVVATDVSAEALRAARRATYSGRTVETAPEAMRQRWFEPRPGGALGVRDEVRRLVDLRLHNLVTERPPFGPGEVDLVVCRNVTIYFSKDTTRALVGRFHQVLAEGGYLLLGHSETLWQVSDDFALVPVGDAFVYRRAHDARSAAPARVSSPQRPLPVPGRVAGDRPVRREPSGGRAAPVVRRAARPEPPSPAALVDEARASLARGDYADAAQAAARAVQAEPLLTEGYVVLGQALSTLGRDADALDPLRKAVYLEPAAGHAQFLLAGSLARLGQHGGAAVSYRAAAQALASGSGAAVEAFLDGREAAELVDLCRRLAEMSEAAGRPLSADRSAS